MRWPAFSLLVWVPSVAGLEVQLVVPAHTDVPGYGQQSAPGLSIKQLGSDQPASEWRWTPCKSGLHTHRSLNSSGNSSEAPLDRFWEEVTSDLLQGSDDDRYGFPSVLLDNWWLHHDLDVSAGHAALTAVAGARGWSAVSLVHPPSAAAEQRSADAVRALRTSLTGAGISVTAELACDSGHLPNGTVQHPCQLQHLAASTVVVADSCAGFRRLLLRAHAVGALQQRDWLLLTAGDDGRGGCAPPSSPGALATARATFISPDGSVRFGWRPRARQRSEQKLSGSGSTTRPCSDGQCWRLSPGVAVITPAASAALVNLAGGLMDVLTEAHSRRGQQQQQPFLRAAFAHGIALGLAEAAAAVVPAATAAAPSLAPAELQAPTAAQRGLRVASGSSGFTLGNSAAPSGDPQRDLANAVQVCSSDGGWGTEQVAVTATLAVVAALAIALAAATCIAEKRRSHGKVLELTSRNRELETYVAPKAGQLDLIAREMSALAPTEQQLLRSVEMDAARLEVGAIIGVGSYAEVRRGAYRGTPVAVKTLKATDARALQRFRAEILLMKDLRHPNIVMLLGASWSTGRLMMVVELFERGNLADVLEAAQLTWPQKFSMLEDIARGMAYLHSARYYDEATQTYQTCIIHRDLKPQNMLVTATLGIKITDFGEARVVDNDYTMTQVGTLLYIAPEIVRGDKYDEKCDVYSFAVVLLGMLQLREHVFDLFVAALRELREEDVSNSGGGGGSAVRRLSRSGRGSDKGQAAAAKGGARITPHMVTVAIVNEDLRPTLPESVPPSLALLIEQSWDSDSTNRPTFKEILEYVDTIVREEIFEEGGHHAGAAALAAPQGAAAAAASAAPARRAPKASSLAEWVGVAAGSIDLDDGEHSGGGGGSGGSSFGDFDDSADELLSTGSALLAAPSPTASEREALAEAILARVGAGGGAAAAAHAGDAPALAAERRRATERSEWVALQAAAAARRAARGDAEAAAQVRRRRRSLPPGAGDRRPRGYRAVRGATALDNLMANNMALRRLFLRKQKEAGGGEDADSVARYGGSDNMLGSSTAPGGGGGGGGGGSEAMRDSSAPAVFSPRSTYSNSPSPRASHGPPLRHWYSPPHDAGAQVAPGAAAPGAFGALLPPSQQPHLYGAPAAPPLSAASAVEAAAANTSEAPAAAPPERRNSAAVLSHLWPALQPAAPPLPPLPPTGAAADPTQLPRPPPAAPRPPLPATAPQPNNALARQSALALQYLLPGNASGRAPMTGAAEGSASMMRRDSVGSNAAQDSALAAASFAAAAAPAERSVQDSALAAFSAPAPASSQQHMYQQQHAQLAQPPLRAAAPHPPWQSHRPPLPPPHNLAAFGAGQVPAAAMPAALRAEQQQHQQQPLAVPHSYWDEVDARAEGAATAFSSAATLRDAGSSSRHGGVGDGTVRFAPAREQRAPVPGAAAAPALDGGKDAFAAGSDGWGYRGPLRAPLQKPPPNYLPQQEQQQQQQQSFAAQLRRPAPPPHANRGATHCASPLDMLDDDGDLCGQRLAQLVKLQPVLPARRSGFG